MCVGFCGNRIPLIGLVGDGLYVLILYMYLSRHLSIKISHVL